jgi:hypothetical protein
MHSNIEAFERTDARRFTARSPGRERRHLDFSLPGTVWCDAAARPSLLPMTFGAEAVLAHFLERLMKSDSVKSPDRYQVFVHTRGFLAPRWLAPHLSKINGQANTCGPNRPKRHMLG